MKKILALVLAMVICLSLAACGGNDVGADAGSSGGSSSGSQTNSSVCTHEDIITQNGIPATCTTDGLSEGKVCVSCGKVMVEQSKIPATDHNIEVVSEKAPTCTADGAAESEACTLCGMVSVEGEVIPALGHTGEWDCDRCSYSAGDWDKYYFVDEFDDPTSEWYIGMNTNATGTFSNSATTDSELQVYILYGQTDSYPDLPFGGVGLGEEYFNIFLYEYGYNQVKNSSTYYIDDFTMRIKTESGTVHELHCILPTSQDRLWVYDHDIPYDVTMQGTNATDLKEILMEGGTLKFVLINDERPVNQYAFEIDASNFKDELSKLD